MPKRSIQISVGGRSYDLPPLPVFICEEHEQEYALLIEAMSRGRMPDLPLLRAIRTLVFANIHATVPDFTEEMAKKGIAVGDVNEIALALLTQSGFPKAEGDSGKANGP